MSDLTTEFDYYGDTADVVVEVVFGARVIVQPLPLGGTVQVGRDPSSDLRIEHASISRHHARIARDQDGEMTIEDLGGANGTRVHGQRLPARAPQPLGVGDLAQMGAALLLIKPAHSAPVPQPEATEPGQVVIASESMRAMYEMLGRVARTQLSVLLLGETGVGKEVFAREVHRLSPRARGPFVALNCAAFTESLLESELFGYEKGAFTGAAHAKMGLFEAAQGGTLFLDEVGELPLTIQAKLLRVVETRMIRRIGALKDTPIDVRFISATLRDLERECDFGRFRRDLHYRLNGFPFTIPRLADRRDDIVPLAASLLAELAPGSSLDRAAIEVLESHGWPGNVRELRRVIERATVIAFGGRIEARHLAAAIGRSVSGEHPVVDEPGRPSAPARRASEPPWERPSGPGVAASSSLASEKSELERRRISEALEAEGGVKTRAAARIGMPIRTFTEKLRRYGIKYGG